MRARLAIVVAVLAATAAAAQSAQDELERQLKDMVGKPPTKLLVEFEGLDQPNYKLVEVSVDLDGSSLPVGEVEKLNAEGKHLIFHGDIKPGKHTLESTVVLTDISGALFSYEAGFKWKVKNTRSFEQAPGLEVQVLVTPDLNPGEKDPKKKFVLKSTATPKMLAKLEDGTMPDVPKPNLAQQEADAGVAVAELTPAEKAKQAADEQKRKKQEAAEEAKRKKDEAAAARAAALEEKKRQREEALASKKAAAEDKKRQREEALAAKKAAAEEKKRQREEALAAKTAPPEKQPAEKQPAEKQPAEKQPSGREPNGKEPVAAGQPEAAAAAADAVDAGAPAVAVAEPAKPPPAHPDLDRVAEGGFGVPLPVIIGLGVALLGIVIFVATRKKSPPQY
jgi:hypothetical protein